ncbi:shikimate O-hydroxycinnamoyltransferase [Cajanus cajan]|uniref:Anthranilate N-benzoyltransferase protein 1 n=1 Tax=Cajanus cajan TaxID=3821 RepID=A0A151SID6_CAJCA|nr:shikimate O-hydroxycinnamoyltransferase [Cajanus cajan]KYP54543.1 Anthranilate N-benzoyltransferase protein 1 [Cajanus cajan]
MGRIELVEKVVVSPEQPTPRKRMFLSNIDLSLVVYQDSASFFDPPNTQMSFDEICGKLYSALSKMLVQYDFMAGRLVPCLEDAHRFEIDCNGAGVVVAAARTDTKLSEFGVISAPNKELRELVVFLHEGGDQETDLSQKPLASLQLTQFGCGSLALASHYNHCTLDGIAIKDFEVNLAALTRGDSLIIVPNADRALLRARNPPKISHPHFEYSKFPHTHNLFTLRGKSGTNNVTVPENQIQVLYLSPQNIASLKTKALMKDNTLRGTTTFQVVAAKIWKARSIATCMEDDRVSTMLFPVDVRKRVVPQLPDGFAGNALVPGFARATVRELKELEDGCHIRKVKEGIERLDDEYIKSGLDWLEENKGAPCMEDSFSLVAWWRLGLEEQLFAWGRLKCATPLAVKPGLVMMLPGPQDQGGLNICLDLPPDQMQEFCRIMLEI